MKKTLKRDLDQFNNLPLNERLAILFVIVIALMCGIIIGAYSG